MSAVVALPARSSAAAEPTSALEGLLSQEFLDLVGWDEAVGVLAFPPDHPQLGWSGNAGGAATAHIVSAPGSTTTARCAVLACHTHRQRSSPYCLEHGRRWALASRRAPALDERHWQRTAPAVTGDGQASLRGLPTLVVAQVLYGVSTVPPPDARRTGCTCGGCATACASGR